MDVEALKDQIKEKWNLISDAKSFIADAQLKLAEHYCPFSVGDKVIDHIGAVIIVDSITYKGYSPFYGIKAKKIKKKWHPVRAYA